MATRFSTGLRNALLVTGSVKSVLAGGEIRGFTGSQPASADKAETGTPLITYTLASGDHTAGETTNGINFDTATDGVLSKDADETWSGKGKETGTIGWFRFYDKNVVTGESTTAVRYDGSVTITGGGGQLLLSSVSIVANATSTIDGFTYTQPASA
jgi:hypothetical protein